jgi:hypothetical protein
MRRLASLALRPGEDFGQSGDHAKHYAALAEGVMVVGPDRRVKGSDRDATGLLSSAEPVRGPMFGGAPSSTHGLVARAAEGA